MTHLALVIHGRPQGKQRPRHGKGGRVYTPSATKKYERAVASWALVCRPRIWRLDWPVSVEVSCYFADARRHDVDNVLKAVMDGMNGVLYRDDSQVVTASVSKAIDRSDPRVEVRVWRAAG